MEFSIFSFANLFFLILRGGAGGEGEGGVVDKHGIYDTYKDSVYGVTNSETYIHIELLREMLSQLFVTLYTMKNSIYPACVKRDIKIVYMV